MESKTRSTFETLEIWKEGRDLRISLSKLVKTFPSEEKYRLSDQILRASRSVTNNIAEGHGRYHYQEYIQFCRHSRGSLYEVIDQLIVALDEEFISTETYGCLREKINMLIRKINGFISYLKMQKEEQS